MLRSEIAEIDERIVRLIGERNSVAKRIGELKSELGVEVVDPDTEKIVIQRYVEFGSRNGVSKKTCNSVAKILIAESVSVQKSLSDE